MPIACKMAMAPDTQALLSDLEHTACHNLDRAVDAIRLRR